jgi:hypothetical protein
MGSFRLRSLEAFDGQRRQPGLFRYLSVLPFKLGLCRRILVETVQEFGRDLSVRPLGAVFIGHVEQHIFGPLGRFSRHGFAFCC